VTLPGFAAEWPAPANVRSWQTLRNGGVSTGPYGAFNLGNHVGDSPEAVARNREIVVAGLRLPAEPAWLEQVHGTQVVDLDTGAAGCADGAVTGRADRVAAIMTADCLPVLFCDLAGTRVAAAHAGWRGLVAGILPATVAALAVRPANVMAWFGPAIGQAAFEVGDEVRTAFLARDPGTAEAFQLNDGGRWQADLYALARRELADCGVTAIFGGGDCTYSDPDRFFSHRRNAPCGRQATLIWLDYLRP
jgi:hypothetical protein